MENSRLWLIECLCRWIRRLLHYEDNVPFMPRELQKKQICQHEAIFRPWIFSSVKKTLCSFIAILLRYIKFLNRTWQHHTCIFSPIVRDRDGPGREETYHHVCDKNVAKSVWHSCRQIVTAAVRLYEKESRTFYINLIRWQTISVDLHVPLQAIIFCSTFLQAILVKDILIILEIFLLFTVLHCMIIQERIKSSCFLWATR